MLKQFNVRYELAHIGKATVWKKGKGGNNQRVEPALTRAPVREPDSSDEEEERLLQLGAEGK